MTMQTGPSKRNDRRAQAAQAGVAALVTASLLAFSLIAFNSGLVDNLGPGVKARRPAAGAARPIVLPASPGPAGEETSTTVAGGEAVQVASIATETLVLGTRETREAIAASENRSANGVRKPFNGRDLAGIDSPDRTLSGVNGPDKDKEESDERKSSKSSKDKQTGHEKARGNGHRKQGHNGAHTENDADERVTASKDDGSRNGKGSSHGASSEGKSSSTSHRASSQGRSERSHGKSHKADRGKSRNKHGR